jgi:hypothetical protein
MRPITPGAVEDKKASHFSPRICFANPVVEVREELAELGDQALL